MIAATIERRLTIDNHVLEFRAVFPNYKALAEITSLWNVGDWRYSILCTSPASPGEAWHPDCFQHRHLWDSPTRD